MISLDVLLMQLYHNSLLKMSRNGLVFFAIIWSIYFSSYRFDFFQDRLWYCSKCVFG